MMMRSTILAVFMAACVSVSGYAADKPNVLLLPVDDLNDWIGCLGGHPQAKTPNMDKLAKRGVLFNNAHCQSPVCNPSRASLNTSLYPSTTGIYFLSPPIAASPVAKKNVVMPKRFENEGYHVAGAGKLFHHKENAQYTKNYGGSFGGFGPRPKKKISPFPGHPLWDWGVYPKENDAEMPDYKIAQFGINELKKDHKQPFFLFTGFYRPHVPQFAPQKWFDMFPIDEVQLPHVIKDDLADVPKYGVSLTRAKHVAPTQEWVEQNDQWKPLVQSYLACVTFVDAQLGKVVDALDASPHKDNTYIVMFADHGFHLGEKRRWAKRSLWEDSTRVPLIIAGPGIEGGRVCSKPVQLLDIYPTLLELTGHKADPAHEGNSLVPLLKDEKADWPYFARTSFGPGNYGIKSERYRYIHYNDGSEEFYDHSKDEHELSNQIKNPEYVEVIAKHRAAVPKERHEVLGKGSTGHQAFDASEGAK
jgi:arylsulfatase A-like enzyme